MGSGADFNNNSEINNSSDAYNAPADGAPGTTTIHRRGPVTRIYLTGNLTASRGSTFGSIATEGWTLGDLVYISFPVHTGAGFTFSVNNIATTPLTTWAALVANGGLFYFDGTDFEAVIPGADSGPSGGASNSLFAWSLAPLGSTVAVDAPFQFGTSGNGAAGSGSVISGIAISQSGPGTFQLAGGTYLVDFQGSFTEAAQAVALLGGVILPQTEIGRSTGTAQLIGSWLIVAPQNMLTSFEVHNHTSASALTLTVLAGGTVAQAMTIRIVKVA